MRHFPGRAKGASPTPISAFRSFTPLALSSPSSSASSLLSPSSSIRWLAITAPHPAPPPGVTSITIPRALPLQMGKGSLSSVTISYKQWGNSSDGKPVVYIMPSMSHSAHVTNASTSGRAADSSSSSGPFVKGWWEEVVGYGPKFGIDLNKFRVVSAAPLGAPYGSSSPLSINPSTGQPYRSSFPQITPADQARAHSYLMDHLGLHKVFAIVGASMGGMQVLQFASLFPDRWQRAVSMAATGRTSPSTVALRSVQRSAVMADPKYNGGNYPIGDGPTVGLGIARRIGTISYRSREEFDHRFNWTPNEDYRFEVESYLDRAAASFQGRYDANCYLLLSKCMDLMNLGHGFKSFEAGVRRIPAGKEMMLLPYIQDALIPAKEMEQLAVLLGSNGVKVHHEAMSSMYGHDAFLKEFDHINPRLSAFLADPTRNGVESVRQYVASLS